MKRKKLHLAALVFSLLLVFTTHEISSQVSGKLNPEKFFGFQPGSDGNLFSYERAIDYYKALDEASGKVKMLEAGESPMGKKMYAVFISSEENIKNLDKLKAINRQLALDATLSAKQQENLIKEGKVFMMITLSMHSTEVGPAQAFPLTAWKLVSSEDASVEKILDNVVLMVVPTHNPDGMDMVVDFYKKVKGTKYEKSDFPGIYHKYCGHDNNRDYNNLTQSDSRMVSKLQSTEWYPQVFCDKHQMGMTGPRYFVPPYHDPIAENVDAEMWNWVNLFGTNMIKDITEDGLSGVSQHNQFDDYWTGSTKTCIWKNIITFLTECASCYIATPAYIEPTELSVGGKGLAEYAKSTNMPKPWPGGWWRLGDIVALEISSVFSSLQTASGHRAEILKFRNEMCRRQVETGKTQPPYYYILPKEQHDQSELASMVRLFQEHGVEVYQLKTGLRTGNTMYAEGDVVIPLAQPYRAFIKEVLEKQVYPERHYSMGGPLIKPYDITSWSFPLHRGLACVEMNERFPELENNLRPVSGSFHLCPAAPKSYSWVVFPSSNNESYKVAFTALEDKLKVFRLEKDWKKGDKNIPAGSFVLAKSQVLDKILDVSDGAAIFLDEKPEVALEEIQLPRIAILETWFEDVDAGWTRYVLDYYQVPFTVLRPGEVKDTDLKSKFDVLLMPGNDKSLLMEGKFKAENGTVSLSEFPPEYTKGLTADGLNNILNFLNQGGHLVSWGESTSLLAGALSVKNGNSGTEEFQLPFNNVGNTLGKEGLYAPGDLVRIELESGNPITYGMKSEANIFYRGRTAFVTNVPVFDMDRRVIATFPDGNVLQSGYIEKPELLKGKAAIVWVKKGEGQLVLLAFSPAFRASTQGAYKLLFNSILLK